MKKIFTAIVLAAIVLGNVFAESEYFESFSEMELYFSNHPEYQVEDWEASISTIWNFCFQEGYRVRKETVKDLLKNPTELYPSYWDEEYELKEIYSHYVKL